MPADMKYRLPIIAIILLILTVVLLFVLINPANQRGREKGSVVLRNMDDVDRIVLVDSYYSTELTQVEGIWYLFGTEPVSPVTVENLLYTASRLEVSSITGEDEFPGDGETDDHSREISFLKGDRAVLTYTFRVVEGRYLLRLKGSKTASYVTLPGYPELDLERVFSANPDHFRDHLLIDLRASEISTIEIELASGEAFRFTQEGEGGIRCDPMNERTLLPGGRPNELSMKLLFSYFTSIRYEEASGIRADSLPGRPGEGEKMATIGVESFSGESYLMQVFSYHEKPGSEPHLFKALVRFNDHEEVLIVNYTYLDVLMRGLSHYFGEK